MFLLDGKPLSPDTAFTHDGVQYPQNWLRLSSLEEKEAIGVTEVADPPTWDQRFAWGYSQDGEIIWKDHAQLVEQWVTQTRQTANTLLAPTDWIIIREADNGKVADPAIKTWREMVRLVAGSKVYEIEHTLDTPALAAYVTGADYPMWPSQDSTPAADTPEKPIDFGGGFTSAAIL